MPSRGKIAECAAGCQKRVAGDAKGKARIFLDHRFQAFGHAGGLDASPRFR
jgi:hypothetical protein